MDTLREQFPFLNESTAVDETIRFLTGTLNGDQIVISQMWVDPQYMLSVNKRILVVTSGGTSEIVDALIKLQRGEKVEPNQSARTTCELLHRI